MSGKHKVRIEIDATVAADPDEPHLVDGEALQDELERIGRLLAAGYTSGEVTGGWWSLEIK